MARNVAMVVVASARAVVEAVSDYELPTGLTLGSVRFSHTCSYRCSCELSNRIAAFGAIRKAAEVARTYEETALASSLLPDAFHYYSALAKGARDAIRAAIGSPKA